MREHRPGDSRDLVGHCDDRTRCATRESLDPGAFFLDVDRPRTRVADQQPPQIDIAAFAVKAQLERVSAAVVDGARSREKKQLISDATPKSLYYPSWQPMPPRWQADIWDVSNRAGAFALLLPALDALLDRPHFLIDRLQSRRLLVDRV